MDHYTVLRCYVTALDKWVSEHQDGKVDTNDFSISPLLAEAFKRVDPHRYVLLASDGNVHLAETSNAAVPQHFKQKRYMKSNPRSNIKDVMNVLYNLLGIEVSAGLMTVSHFIKLLSFFISFQLENEEMVNFNVCSEFFNYVRKQFFNGPTFLPSEEIDGWKKKFRDPVIKALYDAASQNQQVQIDGLSSFVDKQATILFSMKSHSDELLHEIQSIRAEGKDMRVVVDSQQEELNQLKQTLAQHSDSLEHCLSLIHNLQTQLSDALEHEEVIVPYVAPISDVVISPIEVAPISVEEAPAAVEEVPAAVEVVPVEEAAAAVEVVHVEEAPAAVELVHVAVEEAPAAVELVHVAVEEAPVAVEEAPAAVEEAPAAVEEAPAAVEEVPVAVEEVPVEVEEDISEPEAPSLVEPEAPSLVEVESDDKPVLSKVVTMSKPSADSDAEDDIELVRVGKFFVIKGTKVVVSIEDGNAIGYLDAQNVLHKEDSEEVKKVCDTHGLVFSA